MRKDGIQSQVTLWKEAFISQKDEHAPDSVKSWDRKYVWPESSFPGNKKILFTVAHSDGESLGRMALVDCLTLEFKVVLQECNTVYLPYSQRFAALVGDIGISSVEVFQVQHGIKRL